MHSAGPMIAYVRANNYIAPADIAALFADGVLCSLKYAFEPKDPADDPYLSAIIDAAGTERLVSGIGERPAILHWTRFGVHAFTSGSVSIAPNLSMAVLAALKAGDVARAEQIREKFLPFEDQRDAHSQIVVLHDALRLVGIADTGPISPLLASLDEGTVPAVTNTARALLDENARYARQKAA